MRSINCNITPGTDAIAGAFTDQPEPMPIMLVPDPSNPGRCALELPDAPFPQGPIGLNVIVMATGYQKFQGRVTLPPYGQTEEGISIELKAGSGPFPSAPDRDQLLRGQLTAQGLMVSLPRFGSFPWWPACWAWLTPDERASVASQLLAAGDTITLLQLPDGPPLYDEANQFYSPANGFGPLDWTNGNTAIDPQFVDLLVELLGYGFQGVWIFLGGDAGQAGVPIAMAQTALMGPVLAACPLGNLNAYTVQIPGWDGVWHKPDSSGTGWNPDQIGAFSGAARAAGAQYVGIEHANGYILAGEGGTDYLPGGVMSGYDLILGEFDGPNPWTSDTWQLLGRSIRPYYPQPQQGHDDPNPPFYLAPMNSQGQPYVYRVYEYDMYGFVRGTPASVVVGERQPFASMGAEGIC